MPEMGMGLILGQRLEQRLQLRQALNPGDMVEPFRTDAEEIQVSQYNILRTLANLIDGGEFFDPYHFDLEINRAIFTHPLETKLGNFGRGLSELVKFYESDESLAKHITELLSARKDETTRKDFPEKIVSSWSDAIKSKYFAEEPTRKQVLRFVEHLNEKDADASSALDIIAKASKLENQETLVDASFQKLKDYAERDARIIPFAQTVLSPLLRVLSSDKLSSEEAKGIYTEIVESLYMLDRELRIPGTIERISRDVAKTGIKKILKEKKLPVPIQVSLNAVASSINLYDRIVQLCSDESFSQGREIKRKIYAGLSGLEEFDNGTGILEHIVENVSDSRGLASIMSILNMVHSDPDFSYPFEINGEKEILRNLRLQLVDKSIKRLELDEETLEKYLAKLESNERFERIGKIITTVAGYEHYKNPAQIGLLREIVKAELGERFNEWRYSHDKAGSQLKVLEDRISSWKENKTFTRLVGGLEALNAHINSIKNVLPKIIETYSDYYNGPFGDDQIAQLEREITENEEKLRDKLSKSEEKELGFQTSVLRERLSYAHLISNLSDLNTENYQTTLEQADKIIKKKSKNPLYENAKWIRETLDQPVYRDARKITVSETDDLETLLRFGETPVPHCQSWKVNSTLNRSLLSFVADANKKLYHIRNGNDKPISMSMVRLINWKDTPTILVENVYDAEWSDDYGVALFGSLADKALAMYEETGKTVRIATNNQRLSKAMEKFSKKYKIEVSNGYLDFNPPLSKNTSEYWDCGPGLKESGNRVSFNVDYISFGGDE